MILFFKDAALLLLGFTLSLQIQAEPVTVIRNNGASANRVDMVILGDGYTNTELAKFALDVDNAVTGFFAQEPFKEYQNYFNVRRIDVISPESGADHPETGAYVNTALDATYNCSGIQRLICVNNSKVMTIINNSVAPDQQEIILVIVNDPAYGGSGGSISVASTNALVIELVLHEVGHSFGLLADEYNSGTCNNTVEPYEVNVTRETNRALIKWNVGGGPPTGWIAPNTPIPTTTTTTGTPGLYQGAKYCVTGLYRPTYQSKMEGLGYPFEQINEEQLIKRVYNWVAPIDASSPSESMLTLEPSGSQTFQVMAPMPLSHSLTTTWKLDGVIASGGNSYTLNAATISSGEHIVEAEVVDSTSKVRNDLRKVLTETRTWTVTKSADSDGDGLSDDLEINILGTDPFSVDSDNDGLVDGNGGLVPLAALAGGIDADGDDFVDGENDYGTDPTVSNIGDLGPRGNPDNIVNAGDLVVMTRLVTGAIQPTLLEATFGDINSDGLLNAADILLLQQLIFDNVAP